MRDIKVFALNVKIIIKKKQTTMHFVASHIAHGRVCVM